MAVKITIITDDNIEDLSAMAIKDEVCEALGLKRAGVGVTVSRLTARQHKTLLESK